MGNTRQISAKDFHNDMKKRVIERNKRARTKSLKRDLTYFESDQSFNND